MQKQLLELKEKFNLKVIDFEDFFIEQIKSELKDIGYRTNIYYHTSFTTGKLEFPIEKDLLYKSVTDTVTVRQWLLNEKFFLNSMNKKGINLPSHFNETFLGNLRNKGHKIFGAEILVIEATKI